MAAMPTATPALASRSPYPPSCSLLPTPTAWEGLYRVGFARSAADLDAVLRLRFEVFNAELGEGLAASWETGRDEDEFDPFCHHLVVEERSTGRVVGTYRMQTLEMAAAGRGFYAATEYDLSRLPEAVLRQAVEVGRACIHREHRRRQVLYLLWRGLARYLAFNRKRYLFGCCSLTGQDPATGRRALGHLRRRGAVDPELWAPALPGYECGPDGDDRGDDREGGEGREVGLPALFEAYLRFGGRACGEPAIDRRFGTIDFLVLLDADGMDPRSHCKLFG